MNLLRRPRIAGYWLLLAALVATCLAYWPGLSGGFLFDDYPNIVDNHGVQPSEASLGSLVRAALSSPSSEFKRPLASLSFAANYLATGLDPYWMKLTNLVIHLLNGVMLFLLTRRLLQATADTEQAGRSTSIVSALVTAGWLLLPINLSGVLYVVQRMESMANLFVLLGLFGYVEGRCRMRASPHPGAPFSDNRHFLLCIASLLVPTGIGLLAKETAVMLPLYAATIEWVLFGFQTRSAKRDWRVIGLFFVVLALPLFIGLAWLLPGLLRPETWARRDFTLYTRLLSEARIVTDYIGWTLLPTPEALSFYHDDFSPSAGLFQPWTTFASMLELALLLALALWLKRKNPLAALGILLFLGCHLLTGTVLRLELVYEHRNYFASFGLMLAIVPPLAALCPGGTRHSRDRARLDASTGEPFLALPRRALLLSLMAWWIGLTTLTAAAWGDPLHLAEELAARAPESPRAQYELGRTYIIYSHYDPASPFTHLAYEPLERAAALPKSSILPQQALIFMNSRMHLPLKEEWWDSMIVKLKAKKPGVQDESSLGALSECAREHQCDLPMGRMMEAFLAALSHPSPSARLLATYGDYAWNVLDDRALGLRMVRAAVEAAPEEPAYQVTLVRMLIALGRTQEALQALVDLRRLNIAGRLDETINRLGVGLGRPLSRPKKNT